MRRSTLVVAGLLAIVGCEADEDAWLDDYDFVWEGEHVSVYGYGRSESDACAGSFVATEQYTRAVMDVLGVQDLHYDYRWLSSETWQGTCPIDAGACTSYGEPRARELPNLHEIVHAVIYGLPVRFCAGMLEEGLAEYLAGPRFSARPLTTHDISEELFDRNISFRFYPRAGHFVSYLAERYGIEVWAKLCQALPPGSGRAAWDAASEAILDTGLDELLADYRDYPECPQSQYRARLWECAGEPDFVFSAENPTIEFTADCSDPRAMNSRLGQIVITRRVYMPEAITGRVRVVVERADGREGRVRARFMSQECAPCSADPQVFRDVDALPIHEFRPGMHEFIVFLDADTDERATLTLERPP